MLYKTNTGTARCIWACDNVFFTEKRTCDGVPPVTQTARGATSIAAISRAFFTWPDLIRVNACCTAPWSGGGVKKRVLGARVLTDCPNIGSANNSAAAITIALRLRKLLTGFTTECLLEIRMLAYGSDAQTFRRR